VPHVVGVDGCKAGWIAVALPVSGRVRPTAHYLKTIDAIGDLEFEVAGVGIDIPIAFPDAGVRECEVAGRAALGPRRSSLFYTPIRAALEAATHREACDVAIAAGGTGISQQAFGLRHKIFEVQRWLASWTASPVWEVMPELSFVELLGHPAAHAKTNWAGLAERRAGLVAAGVLVDDLDPAETRWAAPDDLLDAAACAWSARRIVNGKGRAYGPLDASPQIWA
jgi:predicted RNase H-like nuclease